MKYLCFIGMYLISITCLAQDKLSLDSLSTVFSNNTKEQVESIDSLELDIPIIDSLKKDSLPSKKIDSLLSKKDIKKTLKKQKRSRKKITIDTIITPADSLRDRIRKFVTPARAGFFSAVLPGLGQIYNKKYWKVPIVYAVLYLVLHEAVRYDNEYEDFRGAYARRQAGFTDDIFYDTDGSGIVIGQPDVTDETILGSLNSVKQDRDLLVMLSLIAYALNIIDASVDAHLKYYNMDIKLSFKPFMKTYQQAFAANQVGVSFNLDF